MVEGKTRCRVNFAIECGHGIDPFGEIVENHNNLFVAINRGRINCHEIDHPLIEGTNSDNGM